METIKKIYLAIMGMTIISLVVLCLYSIGVLNVTIEMTADGIDPTGLYAFIIAVCIAAMSFVFSRSANVIANRKTTAVGYLTVIAGLIILLILAVILIFKLNIEGNLLLLIRVLIGITIFLTVMVLVFEIPQANKSHRHFQYFTAILIAVTTIVYLFGNSFLPKSLFQVDTSSQENEKNDEPIDIFDDQEEIEDDKNKVSTADKIKNILLYSSIGAFLLNPMLRVYYIDKDYDETEEIDNIIRNSTDKYQIDAQPTKVPYTQTPTYIEPEKPSPPPVPVPPPKPTISEIQPVEEIKTEEKVINPNFKQDDLPEAIIPTISGQTQREQTVQDNNVQIVDNNMVQQPTTEAVQQPVEVATPLEQVAQNQPPTMVNSTPQPVDVSTPLDQVVQPNQNQ